MIKLLKLINLNIILYYYEFKNNGNVNSNKVYIEFKHQNFKIDSINLISLLLINFRLQKTGIITFKNNLYN